MDDLEERKFLDPGAVSKHLFCSICMEVFTKPLRAPCGHSFCTLCIEQWLRNNKTCPGDRKPLRRNQMHFDFILENIIGDHQVACPYRSRGCSSVVPLSLVKSHRKECELNPENLPEFLAQEPPPELQISKTGSDSSDAEGIGEVPVMSLKMRLFKGRKRKELCSMFDSNHLSKTLRVDDIIVSDSESDGEERRPNILDVSSSSDIFS